MNTFLQACCLATKSFFHLEVSSSRGSKGISFNALQHGDSRKKKQLYECDKGAVLGMFTALDRLTL